MIPYSYNESGRRDRSMNTNNPLSSSQRFYSITDLQELGLSYYKINKMVEQHLLFKMNNKMYENATYSGEESDYAAAMAYAPKGVICMMTAARYYGLTNYLPDAVDIAIERDMKVSTLPEWPQLHFWYFPQKRYETGIVTEQDEGGEFRIYEIEKTIADILYYRNKIGIEETGEILKNYLFRNDRNLPVLHSYAEKLGCGKILGTYLEVLL
jgi:predicted transcriptional regulator of viral defense system